MRRNRGPASWTSNHRDSHRWLGPAALVGSLALLLLPAGCGRRHRDAASPEPARFDLAWRELAAGDTVAGEVPLEVVVRGPYPEEVVFRVDSIEVGRVTRAPWRVTWSSDAPPGGAVRWVAAEARCPGADLEPPRQLDLFVLPDLAPRVHVVLPGRSIWIEQKPGVEIRAVALDPEDGLLDGGAVTWHLEGESNAARGERLDVDLLPERRLRLRVTASDRWARPGAVSFELRPFRYEDAVTARQCAENLFLGIAAMDLDGTLAQCAEGFLFVPCAASEDAPSGPFWTREEFAARLAAWFARPDVSLLDLGWTVEAERAWQDGTVSHTWIECSGPSIRYRTTGSAEIHADSTSGSWEGRGTRAQLHLQRGTNQRWLAASWREISGPGAKGLGMVLTAEENPCPACSGER